MAEAVIIPVQPPSGGCVLKPVDALITNFHLPAAAFGRLYVETVGLGQVNKGNFAAAFGRLCVETLIIITESFEGKGSRLRAVVC